MNYELLPAISEEDREALVEIATGTRQPEVFSVKRRMGVNGKDNMSVYSSYRWYNFTSKERARFKQAFVNQNSAKALIGWFLTFEAQKGFLDKMKINNGETKRTGVCTAYAINGDLKVIIEGEAITVPRGEGIKFNLAIEHEIEIGTKDAIWACMMHMPIEL